MAKVHHVKKARKDNPVCKKGESYYWWQNYRSPKRFSLKKPTRAMITGSAFLSELYTLQDETIPNIMHPHDLEDVGSTIDQLASDCDESLCNMPVQLQNSPNGELLQDRMSSLEQWGSDIQTIIDSYQEIDDLPENERNEAMEAFQSEVQSCEYQGDE